ncbi:hypothetical protein NZK35_33565 [Stieleria sp. ICT_E10.1]|uniref:hypothetical protein n=1 Tax=Stieleria sedimenti TaxID=2976331 RepID=UPI00217F4364|nr:hypothetical protein [Stieleria sedimenti]MCS7471603.1 hypothetical protein [Stieleria sedimenti]
MPTLFFASLDSPMLEAFTNRVLSVIQREFPTRGFRLGEELGVITDGSAKFGMSNLWAQFQQSPLPDEEFDQVIIEKFAGALKLIDGAAEAIPQAWEDVKPRLRVQLVSAKVTDVGRAITFPFADDVHSSLVSDCDTGYAYISNEDLERWGQSAVDAIEIGKLNIVTSSPTLPMTVMPGPAPLVAIQTGDGYDAARILIPEIRARIISELTGDEDGEVYVGVPNRDFLIAWPMTVDEDLHQQLSQTVALDARRQSHPLSERVLRVTKDKIAIA